MRPAYTICYQSLVLVCAASRGMLRAVGVVVAANVVVVVVVWLWLVLAVLMCVLMNAMLLNGCYGHGVKNVNM